VRGEPGNPAAYLDLVDALRIWGYLLNRGQPARRAELADELELSMSAAAAHLPHLRDAGLARLVLQLAGDGR